MYEGVREEREEMKFVAGTRQSRIVNIFIFSNTNLANYPCVDDVVVVVLVAVVAVAIVCCFPFFGTFSSSFSTILGVHIDFIFSHFSSEED